MTTKGRITDDASDRSHLIVFFALFWIGVHSVLPAPDAMPTRAPAAPVVAGSFVGHRPAGASFSLTRTAPRQ
jgi:hypothetical protein